MYNSYDNYNNWKYEDPKGFDYKDLVMERIKEGTYRVEVAGAYRGIKEETGNPYIQFILRICDTDIRINGCLTFQKDKRNLTNFFAKTIAETFGLDPHTINWNDTSIWIGRTGYVKAKYDDEQHSNQVKKFLPIGEVEEMNW